MGRLALAVGLLLLGTYKAWPLARAAAEAAPSDAATGLVESVKTAACASGYVWPCAASKVDGAVCAGTTCSEETDAGTCCKAPRRKLAQMYFFEAFNTNMCPGAEPASEAACQEAAAALGISWGGSDDYSLLTWVKGCCLVPDLGQWVYYNTHATGSPSTSTRKICIQGPCVAAANCAGHGTTMDTDNSNGCTCDCTDGWSGRDCTTPPATCDTIGPSYCPSKSLIDAASSTNCAAVSCNRRRATRRRQQPPGDEATCCKPQATCDTILEADCPSSSLIDAASSTYCALAYCSDQDWAKCCKPKATCATYTQSVGSCDTSLINNARGGICQSSVCTEVDTGTCCKATCATYTQSVGSCDTTLIDNAEGGICQSSDCTKADTDTCCKATCATLFSCDTELIDNAEGSICQSSTCTEADAGTCCKADSGGGTIVVAIAVVGGVVALGILGVIFRRMRSPSSDRATAAPPQAAYAAPVVQMPQVNQPAPMPVGTPAVADAVVTAVPMDQSQGPTCKSCGQRGAAGQRFCAECGGALEDAPPPTEAC